MQELKGDKTKLQMRTTETEGRISAAEDNGQRYERALWYLLHREMDLTARCEDLPNRSRWNNLRIYRVPEGSQGKDVKEFVKELMQSTLQPMPEINLNIERAHRSVTAKPKNPTVAPRSLIVKFMDYSTKEAILRQAWIKRISSRQDIFWPWLLSGATKEESAGERCNQAAEAKKTTKPNVFTQHS